MQRWEGTLNLCMRTHILYFFCCIDPPERPVVGGQARRVVVASLTSGGTLVTPKHLVQRADILLSLQPRSCNREALLYRMAKN